MLRNYGLHTRTYDLVNRTNLGHKFS